MSKEQEEIAKIVEKAIEEHDEKIITKWMKWSCRSAILALSGLIWQAGDWTANHFPRVMKALSILYGDDK